MSKITNKSGLFVGLNKGFITKTPEKQEWKTRPVLKKGRITKRVESIREIIREVCGYSPLEKRMLEMIRTGVASKEKKAVKMARSRLGTHKRA